MSGIIMSPSEHHADIPDVFSKNANNPASVRVLCAGCHLFVGVLGQFHAFNDLAYPNMKGFRLIMCEEIGDKIMTVDQTVRWLRRVGRNPNLADRKGCGNIMIFDSNGQLKKSVPKGVEGYENLKKAHEMLKKKKDEAFMLKMWREKQQEAMDKFLVASAPKIFSR
jgi:hypothetical protein